MMRATELSRRVTTLIDQVGARGAPVDATDVGVITGLATVEQLDRIATALEGRTQGSADQLTFLQLQTDRLAHVIMELFPDEPSRSEGAIDVAIRLLRDFAGGQRR